MCSLRLSLRLCVSVGNRISEPPTPLLTFYRTRSTLLLMANRAEVPYGTLDLMVLKTLNTLDRKSVV